MANERRAHLRKSRIVSASAVVAALCVGAVFWWTGPSAQDSLDLARVALLKGDYSDAERYASAVPEQDTLWVEARLIAGQAAFRADELEKAIQYFLQIPRDDTERSLTAVYELGEAYRLSGQLFRAEECFEHVLASKPDHLLAHARVAFLRGFSGRRWESLPHLWALVGYGEITTDGLSLIGDAERPVEQPEFLLQCRNRSPDDVYVRLAHVSNEIAKGRLDGCREILTSVVQAQPEILSAQAKLGELLVDDDFAFVKWHRQLPEGANGHPDIWFVRGLFARKHGELQIAARCSWEAVKIAPSHRRANYQLGQVLTVLTHDAAKVFIDQGTRLLALTGELNEVIKSDGRHEPAFRSVVEILESIGRDREARAWAELSSTRFQHSDWPQDALVRLSSRGSQAGSPHVESNPALTHDLSGFPDHRWFLDSLSPIAKQQRTESRAEKISFRIEKNLGVDFAYFNGFDSSSKGGRMFEQSGGGVAVVDFDGDRWPDLYFTQGADWKHGEQTPELSEKYSDRLFRNEGGRRFVDVTSNVGIQCLEYGQGVSQGDFNEDGFPDLYVGVIGANRLFMNNGDGTFSDVTSSAGLAGKVWTSSCLIVDLNADGLPDLYDVNYLRGDDIFVAICDGRGCSPKQFYGESDVVHVSRGDGSFDSISIAEMRSDAEFTVKRDSGLGVIAADIFHSGRPSLFISNDQVANLFLKSVPAGNVQNLQLEDHGISSGLAFNEDGLTMACMGIAAADVNGDDRLDFFVTNFKEEANTLYLQDSNGLFTDATSQYGLEAPSMAYVGWGTQFIDADLDGDPDLVVVNGDVDDMREDGGRYGMKPQFFRNLGGKFEEVHPAEAGPFFSQERAGRALARLDWNDDGRMEFVVSNIREPAVITTNESAAGHFLNVELCATSTARDAIGTVVEVKTVGHRWTSQLVAGDGYMASNQRVLQFGIGDAERIASMKVTWPSGKVTVVEDLPANVTIRVVESGDSGTLWSGRVPRSIQVEPRPVAP